MADPVWGNAWLMLFLFGVPIIVWAGLTRWDLFTLRVAMLVPVGWFMLYQGTTTYWDMRIDAALAGGDEQEMINATADGANKIFVYVLGWLPTGMYIGLWSLAWIVQRTIREHRVRTAKQAAARSSGRRLFLLAE